MRRRILFRSFCSLNLNQNKLKKSKIALTLGFIGTRYKGLQYLYSNEMLTIEKVLEDSLFQIGCISESNHQLIKKIGWSRSSRTDKGVHAARIVISAKLLIPSNFDENYQEISKDIVNKINNILPDDIRVFSFVKVNQGFSARRVCSWREYEYHLPLSILLQNPKYPIENLSVPDFMINLNKALKLMEGSKSMHNFHRAKILRKQAEKQKYKQIFQPIRDKNGNIIDSRPNLNRRSLETEINDSHEDKDEDSENDEFEEDGEEEENDNDEEEEENEEEDSNDIFDTNRDINSQRKIDQHWYENWSPDISTQELSIREKKGFNSVIYISEATLLQSNTDSNETPVVLFRFRGQAFLLHQIRIMVSASILSALNVFPLKTIEFSLNTPYKLHFPLAPACGLLLVSSGFSRNSNKQDYALSPESSETGDKCLLTMKEYQISQEFQYNRIYKQLFEDWKTDPNQDISRWYDTWEYHHVPENTLQLWNELENSYLQKKQEIKILSESALNAKVSFVRQKVQEYLSLPEVNRNKNELKTIQSLFRNILPNGLQAALIVKYRLSPSGKTVLTIIRNLQVSIAYGKSPILCSVEEIINYIEQTGGIERWMMKQTSDEFDTSSQNSPNRYHSYRNGRSNNSIHQKNNNSRENFHSRKK